VGIKIEHYGFDQDVIVIMQPRNEFVDHLSNRDMQASTKMYRSVNGLTFFIPIENDALLEFAPIKNIEDRVNDTSL